ncbi:MAG: YceI family protein [Acidobacteriota bacterium]
MTYQIDPKHSAVHFQVRHMTIAFVKGSFGVTGTVNFDPANLAGSSVDVSVDIATLSTRDKDRDGHMLSPDILDGAGNPAATFKSTSVVAAGSGYTVAGNLTLRGVSQPATLNVSHVSDEVTDPWTLKRRGVTGSMTISRSAFGMGWNMDLPGVGKMVSDEVDLSLDIEMTRNA